MSKVSIFHIGPQKSSTTWQYNCFTEHPEIGTASTDAIHYFDMFHTNGEEWYLNHFSDENRNKTMVDITPSYIRSHNAPENIYNYNQDAKLILCLREPISRGFSHYWHNKKKRSYNYSFDQVLIKYDLFANWIETGFYAQHIEKYLKFFKRDTLLIQRYEDLVDAPAEFIKETFAFIGVNPDFTPSVIDRRVNAAKPQMTGFEKTIANTSKTLGVHGPILNLRKFLKRNNILPRGQIERLEDAPRETIDKLLEICEPETRKLEKLLDIDLSAWRKI